MQRFFLQSTSFKADSVEITDAAVIHQMTRVLRMGPGDRFIALDNSGMEFVCELVELGKTRASAKIKEKRMNTAEPEIFITLYQAMPKKLELFEFVLQKCTEIGVSAFIPLITEHTERRELPKRERLLKILREAAEQSERGKIPTLGEPIAFSAAISQKSLSPTHTASILLHCRGGISGEIHLLSSKLPEIKAAKNVNLFIGPEGGFSEKEVRAAENTAVQIFSLGPRILRTETAAVAATSLILM